MDRCVCACAHVEVCDGARASARTYVYVDGDVSGHHVELGVSEKGKGGGNLSGRQIFRLATEFSSQREKSKDGTRNRASRNIVDEMTTEERESGAISPPGPTRLPTIQRE